ncbi:unnamed protein product [Blepharisma stoltei]|uniref:ODAD1 central coiled coil region domain-containing protein n=1 Tax=Blepharisma stoltei TaxID=1481888 RepID=A0AAU9IFR7_9CILI|nr:unnamed protein product [Blepharisma stoltei]
MKISNKRTRSQSSLRPSKIPLYRPVSHQMSREVENVIKDLEKEHRESHYLDEEIEISRSKSQTQRSLCKTYASWETNNDLLKIKISVLEKELIKEQNRLNETILENSELREKISSKRKIQQNSKRAINELEKQLKTYNNPTENNANLDGIDFFQKRQVNLLRCKTARPKSMIFEKSKTLELTERTLPSSKISSTKGENELYKVSRPYESIRIVNLLRKMIENRRILLKEKQAVLDKYTSHVNYLEDAFEKIKNATGMVSVEEIAAAFIRSESQRSHMHTYFNDLTIEIEELEKSFVTISNSINDLKLLNCKGETLAMSSKNEILEKAKQTQSKNTKALKELNQIEASFRVLGSDINRILKLCEGLVENTEWDIKLEEFSFMKEDYIRNVLGKVEELIHFISSSQKQTSTWEFATQITQNRKEMKNLKEFLEEKDISNDSKVDTLKGPASVFELRALTEMMLTRKKYR